MDLEALNINRELESLLRKNLDADTKKWIQDKLNEVLGVKSAQKFYLMYTLLGTKINRTTIPDFSGTLGELRAYLELQNANLQQLARVYLLATVLQRDSAFFSEKVAKLIEVADIGELETFLKFLVLLPKAEDYKYAAVEALRTNVSTIFDAIALKNPYPSKYFNDQQWNQMYLKAAFMQRDLNQIVAVDQRANKDLTRIISDYAHERWAASRDIDPLFWRPVSQFIEGVLVSDMKRLFESDNDRERKAATLCCLNSQKEVAQQLVSEYPEFVDWIKEGNISWETI